MLGRNIINLILNMKSLRIKQKNVLKHFLEYTALCSYNKTVTIIPLVEHGAFMNMNVNVNMKKK